MGRSMVRSNRWRSSLKYKVCNKWKANKMTNLEKLLDISYQTREIIKESIDSNVSENTKTIIKLISVVQEQQIKLLEELI